MKRDIDEKIAIIKKRLEKRSKESIISDICNYIDENNVEEIARMFDIELQKTNKDTMITVAEVIKFGEYSRNESDLEKGMLITDRFIQGDDMLAVLSKEGYKDITSEHPFGDDSGDDLIIYTDSKEFVITDSCCFDLRTVKHYKR